MSSSNYVFGKVLITRMQCEQTQPSPNSGKEIYREIR